MIRETFDPISGENFPPYGFFNREEYYSVQPKGCEKILYGIKATPQLNSAMHSALYQKVYSGCVNFLVSEKKAKEKINSTIVGRKMTPEQKATRLLPHELTSILIEEIVNLRVKPTGVSNQIAVEQINSRLTKDKFSALEMGVYRMTEIENENLSRRRNRGLHRKLTFFRTGGA